MKHAGFGRALLVFLSASMFLTGGTCAVKAKEAEETEKAQAVKTFRAENSTGEGDVRIASRFWELFFGEDGKAEGEGGEKASAPAEKKRLCVGGEVFGITLSGCGVTVAGAESEEAAKVFCKGDRILRVNGGEVRTAGEVRSAAERSGGEALSFSLLRDGKPLSVELAPEKTKDGFRLGLLLTDTTAGIGTVTFADPESGAFGGLGHGICESGGELLPMGSGEVRGVILGGVQRGKIGDPGELCGVLTAERQGELLKNSGEGVFGVLDGSLLAHYREKAPVEVDDGSLLHEGEATVISTLKQGMTDTYKIEISEIEREGGDGEAKAFRVSVKDPTLLAITGGIVRGMSGSPILQDGVLVGAVTHVLVNDPTSGYGIPIGRMLDAADALPLENAA